MFIRKSTHFKALAGLQAANRLLIAERDRLHRRLAGSENTSQANAREITRLRSELAATYVRDSKGRMARHPSAQS